jgi:hypothetical protein
MQPFQVSTSADLAAVCGRLAALNAASLPLFAAAAARRIALMTFTASSMKWPAATLAGLTRPTIILIGDDPDIGAGRAAGPMGWKIAERLRRWTRGAIVHGAGGELDHYREAVRGAEQLGRFVFIETSGARAREWARFINCPRTLLILPTDGAHPVLPPMGARH